jgi:hypothetical protein
MAKKYVGWLRILQRPKWSPICAAADEIDAWEQLHEYARTMWPHRYRLRGLSLVVLPADQHPVRVAADS